MHGVNDLLRLFGVAHHDHRPVFQAGRQIIQPGLSGHGVFGKDEAEG